MSYLMDYFCNCISQAKQKQFVLNLQSHIDLVN